VTIAIVSLPDNSSVRPRLIASNAMTQQRRRPGDTQAASLFQTMATTCRRLKTCPPSDVASASERGQLAQMWRDFANTVHNSARSRPDFLKQSTCLRCLWQPVQLRRIRSLHGKPHALLRAKLPEIKASDQVASNTRWSLQSAFRFRPALPPYVESWSVSPVFRTAKRGVLIFDSPSKWVLDWRRRLSPARLAGSDNIEP